MLDWDAGSFGVFSMFKTISLTTGIFISMGVLSYLMSTRDSVIGILGSLSHVASCIVFAFVGSSGMMYLAGSVDVLNRAMPVVARAMGSKIVGMEEQGTLQSLLAVSDSICPVISNVVYTTVYGMTLDVLPGAFFLISAATTMLPFVVFIFFAWKGWA
jgi:PCFT/HCP family folate transporter-like MFS transporter 1/3